MVVAENFVKTFLSHIFFHCSTIQVTAATSATEVEINTKAAAIDTKAPKPKRRSHKPNGPSRNQEISQKKHELFIWACIQLKNRLKAEKGAGTIKMIQIQIKKNIFQSESWNILTVAGYFWTLSRFF